MTATTFLSAASLVVRFRRGRGNERLQLKWLLFAAALIVVVYAALNLFPESRPVAIAGDFFLTLLLLIPTATGIAILRYRLYDIDRVISRTLSYALLTGLLVVVYLAVVFALQQLLNPVTGESDLAVAGATLALAALFGPARRRVQVIVDRRFNRARYDAQRTVDEFRARLRDEVDLARLDADLVDAVRSTVEPAQVALWLVPRGGRAMTARRWAASLAMSLWGVTMLLVATGVVLAVAGGNDFSSLLWEWSLAEIIVAVSFASVGVILAVRRPRNPIGWLFGLVALGPAANFFVAQYESVALAAGVHPLARALRTGLGWLPGPAFGYLALMLLLFPHGSVASRRWRPLLLSILVAMGGATVATWAGEPGRVYDLAERFVLAALVMAAVGLILRLHRAVGEERQQLKIFVWVTALAVAVFFSGAFAGITPVTNAIALPAIPVAMGLAVLRYRLYEIDRIISRTVSYALLTGLLVVVYLVAVFSLQQLLRPITGESQLAVAGATLAVAALFGPLRRRLQAVVDRRFNRASYDAQRIVDEFRARLRDEVA